MEFRVPTQLEKMVTHIRAHRRRMTFLGVIIFILFVIVIIRLLGNAQALATYVYPATCEGSAWSNPEYAANIPSVTSGLHADIQKTNSAHIQGNEKGRLVCSKYESFFSEDILPTSMQLVISVSSSSLSNKVETSIDIKQESATNETKEEPIEVNENERVLETVEVKEPSTEDSKDSSVETSTDAVVWFKNIFSATVFAQEVSDEESNAKVEVIETIDLVEEVPVPTNILETIEEVQEEVSIVLDEPQADVEQISEVDVLSKIEDEIIDERDMVSEEALFSVSYSIDGISWKHLGSIDSIPTQSTSVNFDIPIPVSITQELVSSLQFTISARGNSLPEETFLIENVGLVLTFDEDVQKPDLQNSTILSLQSYDDVTVLLLENKETLAHELWAYQNIGASEWMRIPLEDGIDVNFPVAFKNAIILWRTLDEVALVAYDTKSKTTMSRSIQGGLPMKLFGLEEYVFMQNGELIFSNARSLDDATIVASSENDDVQKQAFLDQYVVISSEIIDPFSELLQLTDDTTTGSIVENTTSLLDEATEVDTIFEENISSVKETEDSSSQEREVETTILEVGITEETVKDDMYE